MSHNTPIGRICIAANELNGLFRNGGIGTHNTLLADALSAAGWDVHVLYCAEVENHAQLVECRKLWNAKGMTLWHLEEFASPNEDTVGCGLTGWIDQHSMRVRRALEQLDANHHFDLIEFAEWSGYAFRTVQARAMGTAFAGPRIIVKLHSSHQWCRDGNRQWLGGSDDLIEDYFERYSFEHADFQFSPSQYMLNYAANIGWNVRDDAQVVPNCFPAATAANDIGERGKEVPELVFFGRLEQRKGLKLFLEAAQALPHEVPLAFVGKDLHVDGMQSSQLIAQKLEGRQYSIHTEFDRDKAQEYLKAPNRVAIMPSLVENYPFTVLECGSYGIPFLAANVGGIPEIVAEQELQEALLFEPTSRALREKLEDYIATDAETRRQYVDRMRELCDAEPNHTSVCQTYAKLLQHPRATDTEKAAPRLSVLSFGRVQRPIAPEEPLVSIVVPFYNMGEFLPETLASLATQDYSNTEVIVVNDGSTDRFSLEVWKKMQIKYPHFRFITQENQGLGGARNAGLEAAQGEFFIPVDADNIARPEMVTRFVQALQRNPDISVTTSFFLAFEQTADIAEGRYCYAYRPCGGPYVAAALRNVYGDANAMSRTAALRSVGGYETDKDTTCEDWEMYVKLARQGHRIDVVPEYLFYYRYRPDSLLRTTDDFLNRQRVLRQFFPASELPRAEQLGLWTALASFDARLRWQPANCAPPNVPKKRTGARLAVHQVKQVLRKVPYYSTVSGTLKKFKRRAA